jgi:ligand-binding sensor domain-containing protein
VGTRGGVGVVQDDRLVAVAASTIREPVSAIVQRGDGSIWVGTSSGELFRIQGDGTVAVATGGGMKGQEILSLYEDRIGTLWTGGMEGAWRYREGLERVVQTWAPFHFRASPRTGELWTAGASQIFRQQGRGLVHVLDRSDSSVVNGTLVVDGEGRMLYTSGPELHRDGRRIYTLPDADERHTGLGTITAVLHDREDSLWLARAARGCTASCHGGVADGTRKRVAPPVRAGTAARRQRSRPQRSRRARGRCVLALDRARAQPARRHGSRSFTLTTDVRVTTTAIRHR